MSIRERNDVRYVLICAPFDGDSGIGYMVGREGVTEIRIAKRHGPMDWLPYVEVWKGTHLHSETAQHQCSEVEFLPPTQEQP